MTVSHHAGPAPYSCHKVVNSPPHGGQGWSGHQSATRTDHRIHGTLKSAKVATNTHGIRGPALSAVLVNPSVAVVPTTPWTTNQHLRAGGTSSLLA